MLPIGENSTLFGRFYLMDILIIWTNIVKEEPTTVLPMRMTMKEMKKKVIHSGKNNFNIAAFYSLKKRLTTFIKVKQKKSDDQMNIDKYRIAANIMIHHII